MTLAIVLIAVFDVFVVIMLYYGWKWLEKIQLALRLQARFNETVSEVLEERSPADQAARLARLDSDVSSHLMAHKQGAARLMEVRLPDAD